MNSDHDEMAQVAHFMKAVARAMERKAVPDARAMWSRIRFVERQRLMERAHRPLRVSWMFAQYWIVGGAGFVLCRQWATIEDLLLAVPTHFYVAIAAGAMLLVFGRRALESLD